jgi:hypothetical protein
MSDENAPPPMQPAIRAPSNSTVVGLFAGGGAAGAIVWAAREFFGVEIPADVAVWLASALGAAVSYPFAGGRR